MTPEAVSAAFAYQGRACADLGSPFMGRLMGLFAVRDWPDCALTHRVFDWPGELGPRGDSVPLRLAGALHALALNNDPDVAAAYPPHDPSDDQLWQAVSGAMDTHGVFINDWIDSPPQTNEVRRAAALIAVGHWLADRYPLPIRLSELGASGGLNLMWDRFALALPGQDFGPADPALTLTPDWSGALPPAAQPIVAARRGVDLNPLNPHDPADALRLQAYLWADQPERLALTRAAIAESEGVVDQGDAIDWLGGRLAHIPGQLHLIYHTIAWQYFPADVQARGAAIIAEAGAHATDDSPVAWLGMEADDATPGAALTLCLWPGDLTLCMGRVDFHGRWLRWDAPA